MTPVEVSPGRAWGYMRAGIMSAIVEQFKTILQETGYFTDIGRHVFDTKPGAWIADDIPGVDMRESEDIERWIGIDLHKMTVKGTAIVDGDASASDMRNVLSDLTVAIGVDPTWGGLAEDSGPVTVNLASIEIADRTVVGVNFSFGIEYTTEIAGS